MGSNNDEVCDGVQRLGASGRIHGMGEPDGSSADDYARRQIDWIDQAEKETREQLVALWLRTYGKEGARRLYRATFG